MVEFSSITDIKFLAGVKILKAKHELDIAKRLLKSNRKVTLALKDVMSLETIANSVIELYELNSKNSK